MIRHGMGASKDILRYSGDMAQDPLHEDESTAANQLDLSSDLDMVTLYDEPIIDAEIEADMIRGLLESNGIASMVTRSFGYPNLGFEVKVPRARLDEAKRLIEEAKAAGPEAAAEAESASEETP
jgi:Putative prokaryotic signal transducing protein